MDLRQSLAKAADRQKIANYFDASSLAGFGLILRLSRQLNIWIG
jgi:hypothetical protein